MNKNEADRLRDIADELDDNYNEFPKDSTNKEAHWFCWAATEIRKVLFDSGYTSFNYTTTTTKRFSKDD